MQEVITLIVFAGFSVLYLKEPLGWNHALGFALIAAGAFFIFRKVKVSGCGRRIQSPFCAGVTRKMRPAELSVSSHNAPSGPCRTSRIRSLRFCSSRSSPVTASPSSDSRTSICPPARR